MSVKLAFNRYEQFANTSGVPYAGAKLFTYVGGSVNTKQTTYTESTGTTPNANPIVLDSAGQLPQPVWLTTGLTYKFVLAPSTDTDPPVSPIWTLDGITGINDSSASQSEWIAGPTPTFVSATSFTLSGDQTGNFAKSRRVKATVTAGTVYGTITNSAFAASTTVTVVLDSGNLDSGLSAISYGIVAPVNPSIGPDMVARKGTAVASSGTTDIWSIVGDFVHVTGTTTITSLGTAPYAGAQRTVIFDGALTLTHNATSLILPGAANIFTAAGDRAIVRSDTTANMVVVDFVRASGAPAVGTGVPRSHLAGLTLSTAGGSGTMTIAAGSAADSTNAVMMNLASAISKTTSAWAVGSGNGGIDTGSIANGTWYHFYQIMRPDTGVVDVLFSTSASAPTMPANYTLKRYIGSGQTNGSAQWILFFQDGDLFQWDVSVNNVNTTNPGTSAILAAVQVPPGINATAIFSAFLNNNSNANIGVRFSDPATTDAAPDTTNNFSFVAGPIAVTAGSGGQFQCRTNTSQQIRYRFSASGGSDLFRLVTYAYINRRGRDA